MPGLDHIPIWTHQRDALLTALAQFAGMAAVDGYSPGGRVVARGVRFANGPFLDVHQLPDTVSAGPARFLVALRASADEIGALAERHGWRVKLDRRADAAEPHLQPPWSLASFRRGQGVLSQTFAIEYHRGAATTADYAVPLYDPDAPPTGPARLDRVRLPVDDRAAAGEALARLGAGQICAAPVAEPDLCLDLTVPGAPPQRLKPIDGLMLSINGGQGAPA